MYPDASCFLFVLTAREDSEPHLTLIIVILFGLTFEKCEIS